MSDKNPGPLQKTLRAAGLLLIVVVGAQLYLNRSEDRPVVGCWAVYRTAHFAMVTIPRALAPREQTFVLDNVRRTSRLYSRCVTFFSGRVGPEMPEEVQRREKAADDRNYNPKEGDSESNR